MKIKSLLFGISLSFMGCGWVTCKDNDTSLENYEISKDVTGADLLNPEMYMQVLDDIESATCSDLCNELILWETLDHCETSIDFGTVSVETIEPNTVYGTIECSGKIMYFPPCK